MIDSYFKIIIGKNNNFSIKETTTKEKKRHNALHALKKIEKVLQKNLKYSSTLPPGHAWYQLTQTDSISLLKDKAKEIRDGYVKKQSKMCWLRRKIFSKKKKVEALFKSICTLNPPLTGPATAYFPPTTNALPLLPPEAIQLVLENLDISDSINFSKINRDASEHANPRILQLANLYGYNYHGDKKDEARKYAEAKKYLQVIQHELNILSKQRWDNKSSLQAFTIIKKSIVYDSKGSINVKASLNYLQHLSIDDLIQLLSTDQFHKDYPLLSRVLCTNPTKDSFTNNNLKQAQVALFRAVKRNDIRAIKFLHAHGLDINRIYNKSRDSLLLIALKETRSAAAKVLIELGADIHYSNGNDSILELAIKNCDPKVVKLILAKMDQQHPNFKQFVSQLLPIAISSDKPGSVQFLLNYGAEPNEGLSSAINSNKPKILRLLIKRGANVNHQDTQGRTPLHLAMRNNRVEIINILIENNADPTLKDSEGRTPDALARRKR